MQDLLSESELREHLAASPSSLSLLQVSWIIPNEDAGIQGRGHSFRVAHFTAPEAASWIGGGSKLPLTGGQKEPCKEQSQAFVAIGLVGSQRTHLFKVTFLSCFPPRNISEKMCLKSLLFFEGKI